MRTAPELVSSVYASGAWFTRCDCTGFDIGGRGHEPPSFLDELDDNVDNVVRVLLGEYYSGYTLDWSN